MKLLRFIGLCGTGATLYGLYLIWHPLGWIIGGVLLSSAAAAAHKEIESKAARPGLVSTEAPAAFSTVGSDRAWRPRFH